MKVTGLGAEGYALEASVRLGNQVLHVMDGVSTPIQTLAVGSEVDVEFSFLVIDRPAWDAAFTGKPEQQKKLERRWGWSYLGYGEITAVNPVRIDFGLFELEYDGLHSSDSRCIGEFVRVPIDRIDISPA